ncbi:MAG: SDR family NAD(P)-dependent oxidoreductase, partial [Gaiellaceae bacterium]
MARKKPLSEQVVVIGGGSYGLGRAIAERAKARGARVVIGARTREALEKANADLALETDVSDRTQVERLVHAAVERFGRVDTSVANAMVPVYAEAHRLEDDELRRVFDVNFF